ncbi:MAG TPA: thiamine phosphate synthase [Gemmatimonadales bacterium]|nr:thiamine phosphate synthase [Gemmatimonadales bacterium]
MRENLAEQLRLLLVTDDRLVDLRTLVEVCQAAVRGGVTAVQLRLKSVPDAELVEATRRLVAALPVPVLVNDRLDVALAAGAAGVHLGADDLPPERVRRIVPTAFIIGASVGDAGEAARGRMADYWGIGPLHGSSTKADAGTALGITGARALLELGGGRPAVLIGGVQPLDVAPARAAGFAGVAVASGILGQPDVAAAAGGYRIQA